MRQDSFRTDATASMSIGPGQSPNQFVSLGKASPSIKSSLKRPTIKINVGKSSPSPTGPDIVSPKLSSKTSRKSISSITEADSRSGASSPLSESPAIKIGELNEMPKLDLEPKKSSQVKVRVSLQMAMKPNFKKINTLDEIQP